VWVAWCVLSEKPHDNDGEAVVIMGHPMF
jgi:hypothetical protein